jgi:hypothetical protein
MITLMIVVGMVMLLSKISWKQWKRVGEKLGIVWTATGGLIGFILALPIVILGFTYAMVKDLTRRLMRLRG